MSLFVRLLKTRFFLADFSRGESKRVAFALKRRGMHVVGHHILQFRPRQFRLFIGEVKLGQLHLGARVGSLQQ